MPLQLDVFLLILRLLLIVLLYLFLMQVVIAISRDLKKTALISASPENRAPPVVGHLIVVDNANGLSNLVPGTRFDLAPITTIGRGPTNTIRLTDNFISSEHTMLENHNGVWYVRDANSKYGTFVNNQPANANQPLQARPGDIVKVGFIGFKLVQ
jgi:hypothetical protein